MERLIFLQFLCHQNQFSSVCLEDPVFYFNARLFLSALSLNYLLFYALNSTESLLNFTPFPSVPFYPSTNKNNFRSWASIDVLQNAMSCHE